MTEPNLSEFMKADLASSEHYLRLKKTFDQAVSSTPFVEPSSSNFLGYAEAFLIFAKYGGRWQFMSAEHDEVWAGPEDIDAMDTEDVERLAALGWHPDRDGGFHRFV